LTVDLQLAETADQQILAGRKVLLYYIEKAFDDLDGLATVTTNGQGYSIGNLGLGEGRHGCILKEKGKEVRKRMPPVGQTVKPYFPLLFRLV